MSDDEQGDSPLPMRRIAALWDWLPAFRAVAETENLRRAASYLALSPPALSRTLKLLEDAAGQALFVRDGRKLALTAEGRKLLVAVRWAMRSIDDALGAQAGALRVYAPALLSPLIARALGTRPFVISTGQRTLESLAHDLRRGALDLALLPAALGREARAIDDLALSALSFVPLVICGDLSRPSPRAVSLGPHDGWPPSRPRTVIAECDDLASALAAHEGGLALCLPLALARPEHVEAGTFSLMALRRVPVHPISDELEQLVVSLATALSSTQA